MQLKEEEEEGGLSGNIGSEGRKSNAISGNRSDALLYLIDFGPYLLHRVCQTKDGKGTTGSSDFLLRESTFEAGIFFPGNTWNDFEKKEILLFLGNSGFQAT